MQGDRRWGWHRGWVPSPSSDWSNGPYPRWVGGAAAVATPEATHIAGWDGKRWRRSTASISEICSRGSCSRGWMSWWYICRGSPCGDLTDGLVDCRGRFRYRIFGGGACRTRIIWERMILLIPSFPQSCAEKDSGGYPTTLDGTGGWAPKDISIMIISGFGYSWHSKTTNHPKKLTWMINWYAFTQPTMHEPLYKKRIGDADNFRRCHTPLCAKTYNRVRFCAWIKKTTLLVWNIYEWHTNYVYVSLAALASMEPGFGTHGMAAIHLNFWTLSYPKLHHDTIVEQATFIVCEDVGDKDFLEYPAPWAFYNKIKYVRVQWNAAWNAQDQVLDAGTGFSMGYESCN